MKNLKFTVLLACALAFAACSGETVEGTVQPLQSPSALNSSLPRLVTSPAGDVYLSWVEKSGEKTTSLKYARLEDDVWGASIEITSGDNWFVNWADFPSLMVNGDQLAAHWLQKSDLGTYDYDVRMVQSSDRGQSWNEPFIVHNDGIAAEHGFASMLPMENGNTFITWLDGRNTKGGSHSAGTHGGGGAMTLRAAIFDAEGKALERWELDNRICDCCQTGATMTSNGPVVVYRDRSETEIRDMSVVRYVNGQWTAPEPLAIDMWEIAGCPVNGPAITASGDQVAAAWFTVKGGTPQVKIVFSADAGATFGEPVMVSQGITNGRVGIKSLENGNVVVSWMETRDEQAQVMLASYNAQGVLLKKIQVAETNASRASGFPVITSSGNSVYAAWTEVSEETIVKTAKINF